jgi:hypothetical protein
VPDFPTLYAEARRADLLLAQAAERRSPASRSLASKVA